MSWHHAIESYLTWLQASGASPGTVKLRRSYLHRLRRAYPDRKPGELTMDDLVVFVGRNGWAPETRKSARAAVRSFYSWAVVTEKLEKSPATHLPPVRVPLGKPRPAPAEAFLTAMALAKPRERLMLLLAAFAGLRVAEIAAVHTRDIVGDELRVRGKGGRTRLIPLHPQLLAVLQAQPAGFLFPGQDRGHLSPQRVSDLLAELLPPGYSGHTLRHRFASLAYAVDGDIRAVQELLGHASVTTTQIYTAVPDGAKRRAVHGVAESTCQVHDSVPGMARRGAAGFGAARLGGAGVMGVA